MAEPKARQPRRTKKGSMASSRASKVDPVERLLQLGPGSLTDTELLGIFLSREAGQESDSTLRSFLDLFGGLAGLGDFDLEAARAQPFGAERMVVLLAAVELARRLHLIPRRPLVLEDPKEVAAFVLAQFHAGDQQVLGVFFGDTDGRSVGFLECARGTHDRLKLDTQVVLREALCRKAHSLLVYRYLPKAKPAAVAADFSFCQQMANACGAMGFELMDVLLVGTKNWTSLRRKRPW